jgi:hypothetical protein
MTLSGLTPRDARSAHAASWVLLASAIGVFAQTASPTTQSPCDPALPRNEGQTSGYQQRSDRCEGIYKRQVSSFGVQLVSLTGTLPPGDLCVKGQMFHFVWPRLATPPSKPIQLQLESLRRDLYYRLNTERPPQSSSYEWPVEPRCNGDVNLMSRDVGVVVRTQSTLGSKQIDVLLPVTLSPQSSTPVRPPYRAMLVPGSRVQEVYVTLWQFDGANPTRIVYDRPLNTPPYPSGSRIVVELSPADIKKPGLYRLVLNVEFENGQRESVDRYFIDG